MSFDQQLFLAINFDGGEWFTKFMTLSSGVAMWIPLYLVVLYITQRRYGYKGLLLFIACTALAMGMADIVAGIFKHSGPLKGLLPDFEVRFRPLYDPTLPQDEVFTPLTRTGRGLYGTVSAHAATIVAFTVMCFGTVKQNWLKIVVAIAAILVCYSRIYLAKHYPADIALGTLLGLCTGGLMVICFQFIRRKAKL